jgi:hypothetical protein
MLAGRCVISRTRLRIWRKNVFVGPKPVLPGRFPTPRYGEPSIKPRPPVEEKFEAALIVGRQFGFPMILKKLVSAIPYEQAVSLKLCPTYRMFPQGIHCMSHALANEQWNSVCLRMHYVHQTQLRRKELIRAWRDSYHSVVIINQTARDQVCPAWEVYNGRLVRRALAEPRSTSVALCDRFLDGGSIISDSVTDRAIRFDISENGVVVWIWVETSDALMLNIF